MEENKETNTSLTVIIIIAAVVLIGIVGYFIYTQAKDNDVTEPETTEKDTIDNDVTNEKKSVSGAYSGQYNKNTNVAQDAADTVTNNTSDRVYVELVLDEDGKATFIKAGDTEKTIKGTYTSTDKKVTLTETSDKNDTTDKKTEENKTHEFAINADGSLSYKDDVTSTDTVTLMKTEKSKLKYYK